MSDRELFFSRWDLEQPKFQRMIDAVPSGRLDYRKVANEVPIREMLWGFLLDMVHHRGQLSTYIRPMGGKVPSIYGPSADAPPA